jgi:imidazolonepropionase-like amidohydrolase
VEQKIDVHGAYVIPGLCDAHVHVTAVSANLHDLLVLPASLVAARASVVLRDMLMRGFTTVRDAGGCDWGLAKVRGGRTIHSSASLKEKKEQRKMNNHSGL